MTVSNDRLNYISGLLLLVFLFYMVSCHKKTVIHNSIFENEPKVFALVPQSISEGSGIADSRINQGYIWVEQDSGNPPSLFLVNHNGIVKSTVYINGAGNRDWEDMTIAKGPDPSLDYLYVADIGDNGSVHADYTIYRFPEPSLTVDTVRHVDKIRIAYPDAAHDAEAFLIDDLHKELFIITKRDSTSRIYRLNMGPGESIINTASPNVLEYITTLRFNGVVSAALSPDRKGLLLKTYSAIYHYGINPGSKLADVFKTEPSPVTYQVEPQGEAICFANDNTGFFTLSEKAFAASVKLYNYKRK